MKVTLNRLLFALSGIVVFTACTQRTSDQPAVADVTADSVYIARGDQLVAVTFDTLRNSLLSSIGSQDFAHAIAFCNEQAYPLTTLYAGEGVTIRRASNNYRNPQNMPDSLETSIIALLERDGPSIKLIRTRQEVHYIKPIMMQAMCLNCHGIPGENIKPETLAAIREKYPDDKATGYAEGDLRGIWHVVFREEKK